MNRNVGKVLLGLVVVCLVGVVAWRTWPREGAETPIVEPPPSSEKTAPAAPQNVAPPEPPEAVLRAFEQIQPDAEAAPVPEELSEPLAEAPEADEDDPFGGGPITPESLTGCKYTQGALEVEFAPNGEWKVNGKVRAKWAILGNRVRMYNEAGEEHFLDIVGNKLTFNGEEVKVSK